MSEATPIPMIMHVFFTAHDPRAFHVLVEEEGKFLLLTGLTDFSMPPGSAMSIEVELTADSAKQVLVAVEALFPGILEEAIR